MSSRHFTDNYYFLASGEKSQATTCALCGVLKLLIAALHDLQDRGCLILCCIFFYKLFNFWHQYHLHMLELNECFHYVRASNVFIWTVLNIICMHLPNPETWLTRLHHDVYFAISAYCQDRISNSLFTAGQK